MKSTRFKWILAVAVIGLLSLLALHLDCQDSKASNNTPIVNTDKVQAKNVIVMIADGWGYNQILATDYYSNGAAGTEEYENFPTRLAMSTYSMGTDPKNKLDDGFYDPSVAWANFYLLKNNPTDSAAAATAMSTGTKTYDTAIGVDINDKPLRHLSQDFEALGRSTGVVTTNVISDATPAGFFAHHSERHDNDIIAREMIQNSATDVIMGAGNPGFSDDGTPVGHYNYSFVGGKDAWDGLVSGKLPVADADGDGAPDPWTLIQSKEQFSALQTGPTPKRVIGVAQVLTTLQENRGLNTTDTFADAYEVPFLPNVPSLDGMAKGALNVLDNNPNGFFLMVEGGAVDYAGHANRSGRSIEEMTDFNEAVDAVCAWVEANSSWDETLLIVTGDHETGYLTGAPGKYTEVVNNGLGKMPTMAWNAAYHTNQLIPFFAKGAGADLYLTMADRTDPVRGRYLDNTSISTVIRSLIGAGQ